MDLITLLIGALIGAIVGFPFGIFGNIVTSPIQDYLKNRSLSSRQRKIKAILLDYELAKFYSSNSLYLILYVFQLIALGLAAITMLIMVATVSILFPWIYISKFVLLALMGYLGSYTIRLFFRIPSTIMNSLDLNKYKEKTIIELRKLGGNPEDLDKEETAGG